ncbi:hypothetical protein QJQ45_007425 [Haematococcus lacustris]|nr:hypothetical protein QJQ45_007425 [Haematococcus lacustris]
MAGMMLRSSAGSCIGQNAHQSAPAMPAVGIRSLSGSPSAFPCTSRKSLACPSGPVQRGITWLRAPQPLAVAATTQETSTEDQFIELDLQKPLGLKFARGNDGGAYVVVNDPKLGNTDPRVQPGDKITQISASFGEDVWDAQNYGQDDVESEKQWKAERAGGNYGVGTKEVQQRNYVARKEAERKRRELFDDALAKFKSGDIQSALFDFENIIALEPRNYVGDNFSRVTPIYKVTQYNVACCYAMLGQVDEGLKSLQAAMSAGFDSYDQIRRDKNLEALRKSPKFQVLMDKYDEPVVNWGAIKATFNFFGKKELPGKVVTVDEFRTSQLNSATNNSQPYQNRLNRVKPTSLQPGSPQQVSSEPGTFCDYESDQCAPQKQSLPCASTDLPRTNTELPQLCAVPKKRLSIQRRANRRTAYWLRRKEVVAQCSHCGQRGPLSLSGYGPTALVPMVKSEADVSAPAEQPQMALVMPQPLPLNEATSFVEWRHGAMGQLRLAGLWKAMVGEDTDPVRCERAYAWLLCNCKSHYLRLVVAAETAPAAWKALLADQQPNSYQLWEQLNSLQMQPGETVGQVHSRLLEIVWQLSAAKEQVSEPQQVMALLKAMPPLPQYENARDFITFGSLRSPLSLTEVKRTLQIAESRAQQAGVSAQLAAVRLRGKGGGGGGGRGGSSSSGGSSSRTQPAAVPAASSSSSTAPPRPRAAANVKCFRCGKRGHYARDCPEPARDGGTAGRGAGGEGGGASGGGAGGWAGAGKSSSGSAGLSSVTLAAVHAGTLSHVADAAPPLPACMPAEAGVGVGGAEVHSCSAEGGSVVSCGDMTCCWSHAVGLSPMLPCVVDKHASLAPETAAEPGLLAVASTQQLDSSMRVWVADSGASHHITPERSLLHGYQGFAQPVSMGLGKSSVQLYAYGKGRVRLAVDGVRMELQDVLWAPEASTNYFSTLAAAQKGWEIRQTADTITMKSSKGELVKGRVVGRQYQLSGSAQPAVVACEPPASAQAVTAVTPQLLHERLGHLSYRAMGDMISKGMVEGVELSAGQCRAAGSGVCPGCAAGKLHRRVADTLPSLAARVAAPCDLVHTDVCGPLRIPNAAGYCFVLTFLDEHSGLSLIALLKAKSEVPAAIRDAVEWFETQGGRKVKVLRSDRGTEYVNQAVREFLSGKGIIHQQTAPYSPQQNGSAERLNRTLFEKGRCLLYNSGLSVNFWPYALRFANYVRNLSLVRGKAGTPWELFWGVRPDLSALRVFGARAYAHVPEHMRSKLGSKAVQGVFVGYELSSKAYQVLLPGGKLLITKDVVFDELDRGLPTREADLAMLLPQPEPEPGVLVPHAVHVAVEVQLPAPPAAVPAPLERAPAPPGGATSSAEAGSSSSAGAGSSSSAGAGSSSSAGAGSSSSAGAGSGAAGSGGGTEAVGRGSGAAGAAGGEGSGAANLLRQSSRLRGIQPEFAGVRSVAVAELPAEGPAIPATIKEALAGPQSEQWSLAADEEMQSLLSYGTWELVELPEGCRPLDNRWVSSVKRDGRGSIVRFKARLVVKGFLQREGIDFHELHAPVSKHATVRALLAVAAAEDMELEHLDVKTAFLNGKLEEVIYMHQSAGYEDGSGRVCRLHRALYGLRQAPRAWHARLKEELEQLGFTASAADSCLFTMMRGSSKVLLAVYVDDCLLAVSKGDMGTLEWVKQQLAAVFDIHQLGPVEQFLGMRISRDRAARQLVLSQEQYALSVVDRYGLADSRPRAVPLSTAEQLQREGVQQQSEGGHSFAEVIGSLQHLAVVSRPDIAHAVGVLAKFMSAPTKEHWRVLRGVLRYVADTAAMGLMYGASAGLVGFCDADFAGDTDTRRSTTGHVFMLHGGAVSWSSRRQPTVAASTTESEYMACSAAGKEGLWLRGVLADLSLGSAVVQPVTIMCDNEAALTLVKHPIASARSKHIDVLHHFVRERVARGELVFKFCGSAANVADVFTKALPSVKFEFCKAGMGMVKL